MFNHASRASCCVNQFNLLLVCVGQKVELRIVKPKTDRDLLFSIFGYCMHNINNKNEKTITCNNVIVYTTQRNIVFLYFIKYEKVCNLHMR